MDYNPSKIARILASAGTRTCHLVIDRYMSGSLSPTAKKWTWGGVKIVTLVGALLLAGRTGCQLYQRLQITNLMESVDREEKMEGARQNFRDEDKYPISHLLEILNSSSDGIEQTAAALALKDRAQEAFEDDPSRTVYPDNKSPLRLVHTSAAPKELGAIFDILDPESQKRLLAPGWILITPAPLRGYYNQNSFDVLGACYGKDFIAFTTDQPLSLQAAVIVHEKRHSENSSQKLPILKDEESARQAELDYLDFRLKSLEEKLAAYKGHDEISRLISKDIKREIKEVSRSRKNAARTLETAKFLGAEAFGGLFNHVYPASIILARHLLTADLSHDQLASQVNPAPGNPKQSRFLSAAAKAALLAKKIPPDPPGETIRMLKQRIKFGGGSELTARNYQSVIAYLQNQPAGDAASGRIDQASRQIDKLQKRLFDDLPEKDRRQMLSSIVDKHENLDFLKTVGRLQALPHLLRALKPLNQLALAKKLKPAKRKALDELAEITLDILKNHRTPEGFPDVVKTFNEWGGELKLHYTLRPVYLISLPQTELNSAAAKWLKVINDELAKAPSQRKLNQAAFSLYIINPLIENALTVEDKETLFALAKKILRESLAEQVKAPPAKADSLSEVLPVYCLNALSQLMEGRQPDPEIFESVKAILSASPKNGTTKNAAVLAIKNSPAEAGALSEIWKLSSQSGKDEALLAAAQALSERALPPLAKDLLLLQIDPDLKKIFESPARSLKVRATAFELWQSLQKPEASSAYFKALKLPKFDEPKTVEFADFAALYFTSAANLEGALLDSGTKAALTKLGREFMQTALRIMQQDNYQDSPVFAQWEAAAQSALEAIGRCASPAEQTFLMNINLNLNLTAQVRGLAAVAYLETCPNQSGLVSFIKDNLPSKVNDWKSLVASHVAVSVAMQRIVQGKVTADQLGTLGAIFKLWMDQNSSIKRPPRDQQLWDSITNSVRVFVLGEPLSLSFVDDRSLTATRPPKK